MQFVILSDELLEKQNLRLENIKILLCGQNDQTKHRININDTYDEWLRVKTSMLAPKSISEGHYPLNNSKMTK